MNPDKPDREEPSREERRKKLVDAIEERLPAAPTLDPLHAEFKMLDDGREAMVVDGASVMFSMNGDDLEMTGPVDEIIENSDPATLPTKDGQRVRVADLRGKGACLIFEPSGRWYLDRVADDPYSAQAASRN
ncbi:MAG: hypothetical protein AABM43_04800 [Actinomycetota bacterium]